MYDLSYAVVGVSMNRSTLQEFKVNNELNEDREGCNKDI